MGSGKGNQTMGSRVPKHREIADYVRKAISDGEFAPGSRIPKEVELAEQFGASRPTVAHALRDLQHEGLLYRRAGSGTFVCEPDETDHMRLGLLVPELRATEIFEPICGQIAREVRQQGHTLLWGDFSAQTQAERIAAAERTCRDYIERRVSGVFFAPLELIEDMETTNRCILDLLDAANIPVVLLDRDVVGYPDRSTYDLVGIDNRRSAYVLARHLVSLGCHKIHFLALPCSAHTVRLRIQGYRECLETAGMPVPEGAIHEVRADDRALVETIVAQHPDAIICANDCTAAELLHTLDGLGVKVPEEIKVVGFDDLKYAHLLRVPLTTIHQPCDDIGSTAVSIMLERITHTSLAVRTVLLTAPLVVRESCGATATAAR